MTAQGIHTLTPDRGAIGEGSVKGSWVPVVSAGVYSEGSHRIA